ncbi:type II toxin-antitoxin system VapC family toxin [Novosphingobium sp.]|uniref:type II toxin-antitoxin system VapC family toxin n=1 Tax=Novosphingobium sp. TaxID=1874826 RepID=UPI003BA9F328
MILVDSNVLIDLFDRDPDWFEWSKSQIARSALGANLAVNPVVISEVATGFESLERFNAVLAALLIGFEPLDAASGYLAGRAFQAYRARRGSDTPKLPLPDFLIGGHAQALGAAILTRDARFYRSYFPSVPLITPE